MKKSILCMILLLAWCNAAYGFSGGGSGTIADPYLVTDADELDEVRDNLTAHYKQTGDIDLIGYANWAPIGGGGTGTLFTGSYNGQNYTISNLTIDRAGTINVGLFGHVGEGAVIQNVRLKDVDVKGLRGVGSLIGRVTGNENTLISRCYADGGAVVGFDGATGGLVGSHNSVQQTPGGEDNPVISQCYANINVSLAASPTGSGLDKFGGLAGCTQKGTILDSYSRGSVTVDNAGAQRVGGLVGCAEFRGRVLRSYSTGLVTVDEGVGGTEFFGGLVGRIGTGGNAGVILDSYWDTVTSLQETSAGGTGKNTTDMKTQLTFEGWDFDTIWGIDAGKNNGYPYLLWVDSTPPPAGGNQWTGSGDGTSWDDPLNWSANIPTFLDDIELSAGDTVIIDTDVIAEVNNLTVEAGASLTINSDVNNTGALIVTGQSTGNVIVNRYLAGNRWYIIGPPVIDQGITTFLGAAAGNDIALDTATGNYGATDYNEVQNKWNDYFTAASPGGDFSSGTGYLLRREESAGAGTVGFTGELRTGTVTVPVTAAGFRWNAVGNPYTAAIGITGDATTPNNFIFYNRDHLDARHRAIYIWDDTIGVKNYVIVNSAGFSNYPLLDTNYVQLGQGFIVRAASHGSEITFTPNMRVGQPALTLRSPLMDTAKQMSTTARSAKTQWPGVAISATVNNGADSASAGITFHEDMTLGLDPGYDAGVFKGNPEVAIFTQLAAGDDGYDYGLQCLPPSAMDWIDLPIGLETRRDGTVTFRFEKTGLPEGTVLILDDQTEGVQKTIAATGGTYTTTVSASEPAYGRFYLSFSDGADAPPADPDDQDDGGGDGSKGKSSSSGCFISTVR